MPNLLADDVVFPEFVQDDATPENIARAALELIENPQRRKQVKRNLAEIVRSLGGPGAAGEGRESGSGIDYAPIGTTSTSSQTCSLKWGRRGSRPYRDQANFGTEMSVIRSRPGFA